MLWGPHVILRGRRGELVCIHVMQACAVSDTGWVLPWIHSMKAKTGSRVVDVLVPSAGTPRIRNLSLTRYAIDLLSLRGREFIGCDRSTHSASESRDSPTDS